VLAVTLKKKDDNPPSPDPPGHQPDPPTPEHFNPYEFDENSLTEGPSFASGIIRYSKSLEKEDKTNLTASDLN
jgi:hypothetical protein